MTLQIHTRGCALEPELRESIQEQITTAFRRVSRSVDRIHVHLADVNGPKGGTDKEVLLEVGLRGAPDVIIAQRGVSWNSAVHSATQRAWQSTLRRLDRRKRRPSRPAHENAGSALPLSAFDHDQEELF